MASQEAWRQIRYEREMGRQTGESGSTIWGVQGAREYHQRQQEQEASERAWADSFSAPPAFSAPPPLSSQPGTSIGRTVRHAGVSPGGPGIVADIGSGIARLSAWFVAHVWPLRMTVQLGEHLASTRWKVRLPMAVIGASVCAGLGLDATPAWPEAQMMLTHVAGAFALPVALLLGAMAGWVLLSMVGGALQLMAYLTGLALALTCIAFVLGLIYAGIAHFAGWPPFGHPRAQAHDVQTALASTVGAAFAVPHATALRLAACHTGEETRVSLGLHEAWNVASATPAPSGRGTRPAAPEATGVQGL